MPRETVHQAAIITDDLVRYERVKKKGYVRFVTNFGTLNLELFCDIVPKTCENFIKHCQTGYYDNTKFNRSIRNFMVTYNIIKKYVNIFFYRLVYMYII